MPKVSVIIPCFNGQDFVGDAIRSALSQTLHDVEVIVVDDASTDKSKKVIELEAIKDKRVIPLYLERNGGPSVARNHGMAKALGEWIAILDADDLYEPERLKKLTDLGEERKADFVADNLAVRDFGSKKKAFKAYDFLDSDEIVTLDRKTFFGKVWLGYNHYDLGLLKPIMRRSFLTRNKLNYDVRYKIGEDFLLYAMACLLGAKFVMLGEDLYIYHRRAGSISREGSPSFQMLADMVDDLVVEKNELLDPFVKRKLINRRNGLIRVVRWREIRALRVQKKWSSMLRFGLAQPVSVFDLLRENVNWRVRKLRGKPQL